MDLFYQVTLALNRILFEIKVWILLLTENSSFNILLPLFCIGIGVSLVIVIFKLIRRITWGG